MPRRTTILLASMVLTGCASVPAARAPAETAAADHDMEAALLEGYIDALQIVVQGSPAEQAEVMAAARSDFDTARQGPAVLRYALLVATPGHPAHDLVLAQRLLRDALARPELLTSVERALAIVEAARVDEQLQLTGENARLVVEAQQERERQRNAATPGAALARRLQEVTSENARLSKELDEARAKLQAIANIERNLPERPPATEARKP